MTESKAKTILETEIVHHPECSVFSEALSIAIQTLEKQISKKPTYEGDGYAPEHLYMILGYALVVTSVMRLTMMIMLIALIVGRK